MDRRQIVQPFGQANTRVGTRRNLDWLLGADWTFCPSTLEGETEKSRHSLGTGSRCRKKGEKGPAHELDVCCHLGNRQEDLGEFQG